MAKLSRNQRHKARQRRTLSLLRREYQKLVQTHQNTHMLLMAALVQCQGAIIIAKDTITDVISRAHNLRWKTVPNQENGSVTIELVDVVPVEHTVEESAAQPEDSVTIRVIDDAEPTGNETATEDVVPAETQVDV